MAMATRPAMELPSDIEEHRDRYWRRENSLQIAEAAEAERFIEEVGFSACLTDSRRSGPSLFISVCGRRDAVLPRHVQHDPEASQTWLLKDEILRRGRIYYGKLARGRATFIAPRMLPYFRAIWGVRRSEEKTRLTTTAQRVLHTLRREWAMGTSDLREDTGIKDRQAFTKALDELQAAMIVVPSEVLYEPRFTYLWTVAEGRFPRESRKTVDRDVALGEIARCFLRGAGMTLRGELARVTGLSRAEAGRGNRALVAEGYARMLQTGVYRLSTRTSAGRDTRATP